MKKIKFRSLGTDNFIQIIDAKFDKGIVGKIKDFYEKKEKIFSRFDEKSELNNFNRNLSQYILASTDMLKVAEKALRYWKNTEGYFDPRIIEVLERSGYRKSFEKNDFFTSEDSNEKDKIGKDLTNDLKIKSGKISFGQRMDFSGIAKGYIIDEISSYLREEGYKNFLVDSGGDMRISGKDRNREDWTIALEGFPEDKLVITLDEKFPTMATSGITRRKWQTGKKLYHHLINPKNPENFSFELKSVTVVAENAQKADVWAKTLFLMGRERGMKKSREKKLKSIFLDYKGDIWISPEIRKSINKS